MRPTQEIRVQIRREGIPNAIVEPLDPTAPEARPFRFKPVGIGLLSYATSPDLMTIATNQCQRGAGLEQQGGEGGEGKTLEKRQGSRGMVRQERENCAGRKS